MFVFSQRQAKTIMCSPDQNCYSQERRKMNNIVKLSIVVSISIVLAGCSPAANQLTFPIVPPELADCKFYHLRSGDLGAGITVARCPNSTTTTQYKSGKTTKNVIVVDGVEYEAVEKK